MTPGAVSRQIRMLEEYLGMELFDRTAGKLEMSERCAEYARDLSHIFDQIETATHKLTNKDRDSQINICCSMTLTLRWMVPRLQRFHAAYPQWNICLSAETPVPRVLRSNNLDAALRLDDQEMDGIVSYWLFSNELIPVCSPRLLESNPINSVADLANHKLLHSSARPTHWPDWLQVAGARPIPQQDGVTFASSSLAYQAAVEGVGVAAGQISLVMEDIQAGRLVTPIPILCDDGFDYELVLEEDNRDRKVADFAQWVQAEAEAHNAELATVIAGMERRSIEGAGQARER